MRENGGRGRDEKRVERGRASTLHRLNNYMRASMGKAGCPTSHSSMSTTMQW